LITPQGGVGGEQVAVLVIEDDAVAGEEEDEAVLGLDYTFEPDQPAQDVRVRGTVAEVCTLRGHYEDLTLRHPAEITQRFGQVLRVGVRALQWRDLRTVIAIDAHQQRPSTAVGLSVHSRRWG